MLIERAHLKKGQKVLIHAGSGGVGTFAIQLAKHVGATVATTTSAANVDLVRSLGADIVIDYKKEDFAHVLRDYDVVLNSLRSLSASLITLEQSAMSSRKERVDIRRRLKFRGPPRSTRSITATRGHAIPRLTIRAGVPETCEKNPCLQANSRRNDQIS